MDVTFVNDSDGDWVGLYVDGTLVHEAHSISNEDVLDMLGIVYKSFEIDNEYLEDAGGLEQDFRRLPAMRQTH